MTTSSGRAASVVPTAFSRRVHRRLASTSTTPTTGRDDREEQPAEAEQQDAARPPARPRATGCAGPGRAPAPPRARDGRAVQQDRDHDRAGAGTAAPAAGPGPPRTPPPCTRRSRSRRSRARTRRSGSSSTSGSRPPTNSSAARPEAAAPACRAASRGPATAGWSTAPRPRPASRSPGRRSPTVSSSTAASSQAGAARLQQDAAGRARRRGRRPRSSRGCRAGPAACARRPRRRRRRRPGRRRCARRCRRAGPNGGPAAGRPRPRPAGRGSPATRSSTRAVMSALLGRATVDGVAEAAPLGGEVVQRGGALGRHGVVAPGRAGVALGPARGHPAVAAQPGQQRVDRALADDHAVSLRQPAHQVEAVQLPVAEQREHAVLEDAAPQLRRALRAPPGSMRRKVAGAARHRKGPEMALGGGAGPRAAGAAQGARGGAGRARDGRRRRRAARGRSGPTAAPGTVQQLPGRAALPVQQLPARAAGPARPGPPRSRPRTCGTPSPTAGTPAAARPAREHLPAPRRRGSAASWRCPVVDPVDPRGVAEGRVDDLVHVVAGLASSRCTGGPSWSGQYTRTSPDRPPAPTKARTTSAPLVRGRAAAGTPVAAPTATTAVSAASPRHVRGCARRAGGRQRRPGAQPVERHGAQAGGTATSGTTTAV